MTHKLGVMQGRLSPQIGDEIQKFPMNSWVNEFNLAKELEIDFLEWIIDFDTVKHSPHGSEDYYLRKHDSKNM